jgi:hypothetical protein
MSIRIRKEFTRTLQGKFHLSISFLGIARPQFHFWEYINGNQTFLLDCHRSFICSVQYIEHTNKELTLMLSIRQELKLMLSIRQELKLMLSIWIRNLSEYRHEEFKRMLSVHIRILSAWIKRKVGVFLFNFGSRSVSRKWKELLCILYKVPKFTFNIYTQIKCVVSNTDL